MSRLWKIAPSLGPTPLTNWTGVSPSSFIGAERVAALLVSDLKDVVMDVPFGSLHDHLVALGLADQGARDRGGDSDLPTLDVRLVDADDLVGDLLSLFLVLKHHRRAEDDLLGADRRRVDDLRA